MKVYLTFRNLTSIFAQYFNYRQNYHFILLYTDSLCVSISSHFQRNVFLFYKIYTSIICTKRPQKASEKRPEMEWKKFGE